ncbi:MAG: hypothetical protein IJX74_00425 [Clostridia bacterium]|nr:hypothetical protein [Clostridia bacterium]
MGVEKRKCFLKSIVYVFSVNVLVTLVMLLYANHIIRDTISLIIILAIFTVSAPLYFFIKGNTSCPWLYTAVSGISHIAFTAVRILVFNAAYNGWETAMFFYAEIFTVAFFVAVLLLDVAVRVIKAVSTNKNRRGV